MSDREQLTAAARMLAQNDPAALQRLFDLGLALLLGDWAEAHRLELEHKGRQVIAQALGLEIG